MTEHQQFHALIDRLTAEAVAESLAAARSHGASEDQIALVLEHVVAEMNACRARWLAQYEARRSVVDETLH